MRFSEKLTPEYSGVIPRALRSQKGGKGWFVFDDTARAMHKPIEHYFEMGIATKAKSIKEL